MNTYWHTRWYRVSSRANFIRNIIRERCQTFKGFVLDSHIIKIRIVYLSFSSLLFFLLCWTFIPIRFFIKDIFKSFLNKRFKNKVGCLFLSLFSRQFLSSFTNWWLVAYLFRLFNFFYGSFLLIFRKTFSSVSWKYLPNSFLFFLVINSFNNAF